MAPADHYATLGVARTADTATITKAFRKLARKSHPDVNKDAQAGARFKTVADAYAVLKNPDKRAAYDHPAPPPQPRRHPSGPTDRPAPYPEPLDDSDLADLLAAFTRSVGEGGGAQMGGAAHRAQAGRSHERTVHLSLRDAHRGTTLRLSVPAAAGVKGERSLDVTVSPGTSNGQVLRLRGQGEAGVNGGPAGDIYLRMALQSDPVFSVKGHDLYMDLTLAPWQAVLGADVEVPTLDGPVLLSVPSGTRAGRRLRLRGRGLAPPQPTSDGRRGDLYALARIDVPASVSDKEAALYRLLAEAAQAQTAFAQGKTPAPSAVKAEI